MTQSMVYKKLVNATGRNRKGKGDWSCGKNGSSFTFFFFPQVSLLNMVVKIGFIQKEPRLEKKWSWHSRLLRVSVSDIRNRKYKSPTAQVYLRKARRPE